MGMRGHMSLISLFKHQFVLYLPELGTECHFIKWLPLYFSTWQHAVEGILSKDLKLRFRYIFSILDSNRSTCNSNLPIHRTTSKARLTLLTANLHILLDLMYKFWMVSQYRFVQAKHWHLLEAADVAKAPAFSFWNVSMILTKGRW